jgi:sugar lactone lactonase YvrE
MFANKITAYDYEAETGDIRNRRVFVEIPKDAGMPDGLTVDSEGFVWAAHWGGWRVTRYDPSGKLDREIRVPAELVTCIGFGGEGLDELYITTAWYNFSEQQRKDQPQAGDLFRIKTDVKGIAEPGFLG